MKSSGLGFHLQRGPADALFYLFALPPGATGPRLCKLRLSAGCVCRRGDGRRLEKRLLALEQNHRRRQLPPKHRLAPLMVRPYR